MDKSQKGLYMLFISIISGFSCGIGTQILMGDFWKGTFIMITGCILMIVAAKLYDDLYIRW